VAAVDILLGDGPQVFVVRVLVNALADLLPANLVVKLTHLLFDIRLDCHTTLNHWLIHSR
jgi:hypothetical protein